MDHVQFKFRSDKLGGSLLITYFKQALMSIELDIKKPLTPKQWFYMSSLITPHLDDLKEENFLKAGLSLDTLRSEASQLPANQRIALFCAFYEKYKSIKYKVSPADSGKIKLIQITEDLLTAYFSSQNFLFKGKHSISNLTKYYNELRAEMAEAGKSKHPSFWEKAYELKLKPDEQVDYWRHLREIGLQPKKDRLGNITDWIKI